MNVFKKKFYNKAENFVMKALFESCLVCDCDLTYYYVCSENYIDFEVFGIIWTIVPECPEACKFYLGGEASSFEVVLPCWSSGYDLR